MRRNAIVISALAVTLLGSAAVIAGEAQQPQQPMSFFVASTVPGTGNLGGLAGADAICQNLAQAVGAGGKTWHAYLSTQAEDGKPAVNAKDRIGKGPWQNAKGEVIARTLDDLHSDKNNLTKQTALDCRNDNILCSQIDIGNAATPLTDRMVQGQGVLQPDGRMAIEARMNADDVGREIGRAHV